MCIISQWSWWLIYIDFQRLSLKTRGLDSPIRYRGQSYLFHQISLKVWGDFQIKSVSISWKLLMDP